MGLREVQVSFKVSVIIVLNFRLLSHRWRHSLEAGGTFGLDTVTVAIEHAS